MSSIEGTVGQALAIQKSIQLQEKDHLLLSKVLDNQAASILGLIQSATTGPQSLATSGMVGTRVHVTA